MAPTTLGYAPASTATSIITSSSVAENESTFLKPTVIAGIVIGIVGAIVFIMLALLYFFWRSIDRLSEIASSDRRMTSQPPGEKLRIARGIESKITLDDDDEDDGIDMGMGTGEAEYGKR